MPDTLPSTTLPIYPGLGQAPNMLACIPLDLINISSNSFGIEQMVLTDVLKSPINQTIVAVSQKCTTTLLPINSPQNLHHQIWH